MRVDCRGVPEAHRLYYSMIYYIVVHCYSMWIAMCEYRPARPPMDHSKFTNNSAMFRLSWPACLKSWMGFAWTQRNFTWMLRVKVRLSAKLQGPDADRKLLRGLQLHKSCRNFDEHHKNQFGHQWILIFYYHWISWSDSAGSHFDPIVTDSERPIVRLACGHRRIDSWRTATSKSFARFLDVPTIDERAPNYFQSPLRNNSRVSFLFISLIMVLISLFDHFVCH
jgi:hypothetical protein